jgi:hypothetical protein
LFNANSTIVQLYYGENKLIFNEIMMVRSALFLTNDTIDIICSVDKLINQIVFKNPDGKENGYCGAPFRVGKGKVFCNGTFIINQDLTTNTTTLIIGC